jgi:hypothetical protein
MPMQISPSMPNGKRARQAAAVVSAPISKILDFVLQIRGLVVVAGLVKEVYSVCMRNCGDQHFREVGMVRQSEIDYVPSELL